MGQLTTDNNRCVLRREAVMHAAAAVFAAKGFHGASTQDIADRPSLKQGSLYYYLRSKEAALEAVCLMGVRESVARLKKLVSADLPLREKIRQIVHSLIYGLQMHCDHLIVFTQHGVSCRQKVARIRAEGSRYQKLLEDMLQKAQIQGKIGVDIDIALAACALTGLCNSVAPICQQDPSLDIERIAQQYARLFFVGIQPEVPA